MHWGRLFLLAWIAALSHIGLDWMNNYGVRPFWPFSPNWYEGDLLFILEPVMLGVLALAIIIPWLLGLADREIGARRIIFRGQTWAWFALSVIAVMLGVRAVEHDRALDLMGQREWAAGEVKRVQASSIAGDALCVVRDGGHGRQISDGAGGQLGGECTDGRAGGHLL